MELIIIAAIAVAVVKAYSVLTAGTARPSSRPVHSGHIVTEFARQKRSEYRADARKYR